MIENILRRFLIFMGGTAQMSGVCFWGLSLSVWFELAGVGGKTVPNLRVSRAE
jgi:hypothetical protein